MELMPALRLGWLNGWILLGVEYLVQGFFLLVLPGDVVARLMDRSGWSVKQRAFLVAGKFFSLACLVLIVFTPLKLASSVFVVGMVLYAVGLVGLVLAMLNFRDTPPGQPAAGGLYRISRHPQIVSLFVLFLGICVAIGSWAAVFLLVVSRLLQHFSLLAEEEACLQRYGQSYRDYMARVPRYFLFF
jgi:protein-S-isoprenylcysteine O-methyltransferase Ste14